jgi:hypothetical protein
MPPCRESDELAIELEDEPDEPEAMPAGPSEPAHAGVMTAVVAAMTTTGAASRPASDRAWLRSLTGRASSPGRARTAAAMTTSRISSIAHTTSRPPQASTVLVSGPIGSPMEREQT